MEDTPLLDSVMCIYICVCVFLIMYYIHNIVQKFGVIEILLFSKESYKNIINIIQFCHDIKNEVKKSYFNESYYFTVFLIIASLVRIRDVFRNIFYTHL